MSAEYDGNIKLGVSVSADTKSVETELGALRKQIVDMFSSVDKSLANGSGSFSNIEKTLTTISADIAKIGKAILVLPESKIVTVVETIKTVGSSAKSGASDVQKSVQNMMQSFDAESASVEELYERYKKLKTAQSDLVKSKLMEGYTFPQANNSKDVRALGYRASMVEQELNNRGLSAHNEYSPQFTVNGGHSVDQILNSINQAEMSLADLQTEMNQMQSTDAGFAEKTARVQELTEILATLNTELTETQTKLAGLENTNVTDDVPNIGTYSSNEKGYNEVAMKYMDIASESGMEAANAFVSKYNDILRTKGTEAAREFAQNFNNAVQSDSANSLSEMQKQLIELQNKVRQFNSGKLVMSNEDLGNTLNEISRLKTEIAQITEIYRYMGADTPMDDTLRDLINEATILQDKLKTFNTTGVGFASAEEAGRAVAHLRELQNSINGYRKSVLDASQEAPHGFQRVADAVVNVSNSVRSVSSSISKLGNGFKSVASKMIGRIRNIISWFTKLRKSSGSTSIDIEKGFKRAVTTFAKLALGVRGMFALFRRLRSTAIEAFKAMATQVPEVNTVISNFMTALNQLKGSFATAFEPIVSVVLPILTQFINTLSVALTTLAKFFAVLTGSNKIYKYTAAQTDYAKSIADTGESAEQAKKSVMGFDELNKLNDDSSSSSSSGTPGVGDGTWVEEAVDPNSAVSKFADMLKKAWETGDFFDVGRFLGEKLRDALNYVDNWITTEGYALAKKIGHSFGTLINGFVTTPGLADSIGRTIADAINMAMIGLDEFLVTTQWFDVGKFIGDSIAALIKNFKWDLLGKTVADALLAGINTWYGFLNFSDFDFSELGNKVALAINTFLATMLTPDAITGLDGWQKLGKNISDTVKGILEFFITAINNINWDEVGQAIGEVLGNIDWGGIAWDFAKLVGAVIKAIAQAFLNWAETDPLSASIATIIGLAFAGVKLGTFVPQLVSAIAPLGEAFSLVAGGAGTLHEALVAVFGGVTTTIAGVAGIIGGSILAVGSFFSMLKDGFSWFKEALMIIGIAIAAVGAIILGAPAVIVGVIAAIVAAVATLVVVVKEHWTEITTFLKGLGSKMLEIGKNIIQGLLNGLLHNPISEWIKEHIVNPIVNTIKSLFGIHSPSTVMAEIGVNIIQGLFNGIQSLLSIITEIFTTIRDAIIGVWDGVKSKTEEIWNGITTFISTAITSVQTILTTICTAIGTAWDLFWTTVSTTLTTIWTTMSTMVSTVITAIQTTISTICTAIGTAWDTFWTVIQTTLTTIWTTMSTFITTTINTIKTTISTVMSAISTQWSTVLNTIKSLTSSVFNGIRSTVTSIMSALRSGIVSALSAISSTWSSVWNSVKSTTSSIFNGIKSIVRGAINGIIGFVNGMVRGIVSGINAAISAINSIHVTIPSWVPGFGGSSFGFSIGTISAPSIPYLAQGAVLPPNKPFTAVVGDQKNGTNIEAPLSTIEEAVANVLDDQLDAMMAGFEAIVSAIQNKDMSVVIGDKEIGQASDRYSRRQSRMRGTT